MRNPVLKELIKTPVGYVMVCEELRKEEEAEIFAVVNYESWFNNECEEKERDS